MAAVFAPQQTFSAEARTPVAPSPLKPSVVELHAISHAFELPIATNLPSVEILDATTAEIRRKHGEVRLVSKSHISAFLRKYGLTQIPGKVPSVGSIVWCYFPLEQGPPRHPCLVLAVDAGSDGLDWLTVVLGKSVFDPAGDHRTVYDNELVLYANDPGFSGKALHATKFCFAQWCVRTFPYTMEHFHIPPGQMWPKVGSIDMREPKVTDRLAEIGELIDIDATVDAARAAVGVLS